MTKAAAEKAQAEAIADYIGRIDKGEPLPTDCNKTEASGVKLKDRLDVALRKTDEALYQANRRIVRCAKFNVAVNVKSR